jgi:hypothetical protein
VLRGAAMKPSSFFNEVRKINFKRQSNRVHPIRISGNNLPRGVTLASKGRTVRGGFCQSVSRIENVAFFQLERTAASRRFFPIRALAGRARSELIRRRSDRSDNALYAVHAECARHRSKSDSLPY